MARLIINADDFGLTQGVNRAIAELATQNAITSATLMACGAAFDDAISRARSIPSLGVGCHVVFVDGHPTGQASSVDSLLQQPASEASFRRSLAAFAVAVLSGKIKSGQLQVEAEAQISKLQAEGIRVTHVDTHKHTHMFPQVSAALLNAAAACNVSAIRNPFEPAWSASLDGKWTRRASVHMSRQAFQTSFLNQPLIASGKIRTTQGSIGVSATGSLTKASLRRLLEAIPQGTWELVTHPGYRDRDLEAARTRLLDEREEERQALLDEIDHCGHQLISFADLHR